jgi:hypothetical protein
MLPGRMEVCQALGRPRSASCWVDEENAAQGLGGLNSRELPSCPSRPEWLRRECDFEPGGDRHFSGLGVIGPDERKAFVNTGPQGATYLPHGGFPGQSPDSRPSARNCRSIRVGPSPVKTVLTLNCLMARNVEATRGCCLLVVRRPNST